MLGRARKIVAPSKWYNENRHDAMKVMANKSMNEGISGAFFRAVEPFVVKLTYKWWIDIAYQRGLALEDFLLFQDRQLRRDPYWEN
jgi:hypothetical protein